MKGRSMLRPALVCAALAAGCASARADKVALSDDEMSGVAGQGVAILVDL
jgi:hypothetical protein